MSQLLALSISVAVLGAVWAYLALGPLAPYVLVWAGFITAGCFFAAGGDNNALVKTLIGIIYGAMFALVMFVEPKQAELSVKVPLDRLDAQKQAQQ